MGRSVESQRKGERGKKKVKEGWEGKKRGDGEDPSLTAAETTPSANTSLDVPGSLKDPRRCPTRVGGIVGKSPLGGGRGRRSDVGSYTCPPLAPAPHRTHVRRRSGTSHSLSFGQSIYDRTRTLLISLRNSSRSCNSPSRGVVLRYCSIVKRFSSG